MKSRLLSLCVAALSVFGVSCEKASVTDNQASGEITAAQLRGRGALGAADNAGCVTKTRLIVEKDGQNNGNVKREGDVEITIKSNKVEVAYICDPGFKIKNVSVWIGPKSLAPVNSSGHPEFGHFQIRDFNVGNLSSYTATVNRSLITMTSDPVNDPMIVIAHANVYKHNTESSYGEGPTFTPNGKAMYVSLNGSCWHMPNNYLNGAD